MEGDTQVVAFVNDFVDFYPRPPGGGRHPPVAKRPLADLISIHALRVEGDKRRARTNSSIRDFYPRPPGGGRPLATAISFEQDTFLSTPSGWRATFYFLPSGARFFYFYPRPPGGGRRLSMSLRKKIYAFLSLSLIHI